MTARSAGSAFVDIQPRIGKGFAGALGGKLAGPMKAIGVGAAAVFGTALAGGVAAFNIGKTFDDAFDTIRVGTGATGDALEDLKGDFKEVFKSVPAEAGDVSTAIADINTRLGLSGQPLQDLSTQMLELSRITGTDLGTNIESVTRAFGDWAVEDQGAALDTLFRASQATGPSVDRLGQMIVKYGAPLRQLGFGFEESAALLGKFEKEGVNTELVMGSMRIALGKMAREGEPAQETFQRVTEEIKNAGSASEANALALELFGARAGPDMAAAIREGRFELGDLFDQVANGTETVMQAADDTKDFSERWQEFKNRTLVAIEPLASRVFQGVGRVFETIAPKIESFFTNTLIPAFDSLSAWWTANGPAITSAIKTTFQVIGDVIGGVVTVIQTVIGWFQQAQTDSESSFGGIAAFAQETWPKIQEIIEGVMEVIRTVIETVTDIIQAIWSQHGDRIMKIVGAVWNVIKTVITTVLGVIQGVIDVVMGLITGDWDRAWEGIKGILSSVWDGVKGIITNALDIIKNIIPIALDFIQEVWERAWDTVVGLLGSVWDDITSAISDGVENVKTFFRELPGNILDALGDLGKLLYNSAVNLINGLVQGIRNSAHRVIEAIKNFVLDKIPGFVKKFFGIASPSKMFTEFGRSLPEGLAAGIHQGASEVVDAAAAMIGGIPTQATLGLSGAGGGVSGGVHLGGITLQGTPATLIDDLMRRQDRELRMQS